MPKTIESEVFAVGIWNNLKFTLDDLKGIATNFKLLRDAQRVPLKLGHNPEQKVTDGQPALGWVDDVWIDEKQTPAKLMARFTDVPSIIAKAFKKKLYRNVSIELDFDVMHKKKNYDIVLSAIALLGADIPAVNNLADLAAFMTRDPLTANRSASFSAISTNKSTEGNDMPTIEEVQAQLAEANAKAATFERTNTALTSENDTLKASTKERDARENKASIDFSRKTVTDYLEQAVKDELITPAQRETFSRALRVDDDEAVVSLKLEDVKAMIGDKKTETFSKSTASQDGDNDQDGDADDKLDRLTRKFMVDHGVKRYSEALEAVQLANPKLAKEYILSNGQTHKGG